MGSVSNPAGTITRNSLVGTISDPPGSITTNGAFPILTPTGYLYSGVTYTRAGNKTYFDSAGALQTAGANVWPLEYNPTTLAFMGRSVWEARTNSIRNNTMVGAAVGVARSVGTISAATRTASSTVVVASVGHTVQAGDVVTCSGASIAAYNGTYAVSAVVANVSFSYVVGSSGTDAATGFTYSAVSPGTLPTNWSWTIGTTTGLIREVVGTGVEDGIEYTDLRLSGTAGGAGSFTMAFESFTQVTAIQNQIWSGEVYQRLVGGSFTGLSGQATSVFVNSYTAAGAFDAISTSQVRTQSAPTSAALRTQRGILTGTLTSATTARVNVGLFMSIANGAAIDVTLRIGLPQLELGAFATPVIKTTTVAATRNADVAVITGASFSSFYNQTQGTIVATWIKGGALNFQAVCTISDGSSNNQITLTHSSGAPNTNHRFDVTTGGVTQASITLISPSIVNTEYTTAAAFKANDFAACVDGGTVQTDASGTIPTVNQLAIGANATLNGGFLCGWILGLSMFPQRLPNATLVSLSA